MKTFVTSVVGTVVCVALAAFSSPANGSEPHPFIKMPRVCMDGRSGNNPVAKFDRQEGEKYIYRCCRNDRLHAYGVPLPRPARMGCSYFEKGLTKADRETLNEDRTLAEVRDKGFLHCGVSQGLPGFSMRDDQGNWTGIDVDLCRAVAAAVLGDAGLVNFAPLSAKERFIALQSGEIHILSRNVNWTMSRDTAFGLKFGGVSLYDGQAFMARASLGVRSALELSGAAVCTHAGTTAEFSVAEYFRANGMEYKVVSFEKADEVVAAYDANRCDVLSANRTTLARLRLRLANPDEHTVLPETLSPEPLGPVVRQGDDQWADIVRWTLNLLVNAEELGVSSESVNSYTESANPNVARLLDLDRNDFGRKAGLGPGWSYQVLSQVGNYGEVYERNLGSDSALSLSRGLNALWTNGGLLYAPPMR